MKHCGCVILAHCAVNVSAPLGLPRTLRHHTWWVQQFGFEVGLALSRLSHPFFPIPLFPVCHLVRCSELAISALGIVLVARMTLFLMGSCQTPPTYSEANDLVDGWVAMDISTPRVLCAYASQVCMLVTWKNQVWCEVLMWGVAPHRIDAHMRDVHETRRNDYTTSQPYYNHVNVNVIVMVQSNVPERSQNNQHRANKSWHDLWPPHSVPNGPTSISSLPPYEECVSRARTNPQQQNQA